MDPTLLLPVIQIFGVREVFRWVEVRKFYRKNETATVWLRPAEFNLTITILTIDKELIAFPVRLCLENFIFFRFRSSVIFLILAEVTPLNFSVRFFLDLLLKLILPMVIIFKRSLFLPALTVLSGQEAPNMCNDQSVAAT